MFHDRAPRRYVLILWTRSRITHHACPAKSPTTIASSVSARREPHVSDSTESSAPSITPGGGTSNKDWWPTICRWSSASALVEVQSDGRRPSTTPGSREPRPGGREERSGRVDDRLAALVARGLRTLRSALHSHGLAQRRHVPHGRWSWRRWPRPAAFCSAEQLAR